MATAKLPKATNEIVAVARRLYGCDDIEIDDDTVISDTRPEGRGVWVRGWLWVPECELPTGADGG